MRRIGSILAGASLVIVCNATAGWSPPRGNHEMQCAG